MSSSCFITGGTGFAGLNFVIEVLEKELFDKVYCLVRENSFRQRYLDNVINDYDGKSKTVVEILHGDLSNRESLEKIYPTDLDAIFHIAANIDVQNKEINRQNLINIEGTRILCDLAIERKTHRFIHCSSISVYGTCEGGVDDILHIDENKKKKGVSAKVNYARSKYFSELEVLKAVEEKGLDAVVVQPGFLMGEHDYSNTSWNQFVKFVKDGEFMLGLPDGVICLTDVRSLARVMYSAFEYGKKGETYVIGGVNVSWKEMGDVVTRYYEKEELSVASYKLFWLIGLGYEVVYGIRNVCCCLCKKDRIVPDISRLMIGEFLYSKLEVDTSKAVKELGYEVVDMENIIIRTCKWIDSLEQNKKNK